MGQADIHEHEAIAGEQRRCSSGRRQLPTSLNSGARWPRRQAEADGGNEQDGEGNESEPRPARPCRPRPAPAGPVEAFAGTAVRRDVGSSMTQVLSP